MSSSLHKTNISTNVVATERIKKYEEEFLIKTELNTNQIDKLDFFTVNSIIYNENGKEIGHAKLFQKYILEYKHGLKYQKEYNECSIFELEDIFIEKEYRGIGLGTEIIQNIINLCKLAQIQESTDDFAIELEMYNKYKEDNKTTIANSMFNFFNRNSFKINYPYAVFTNINEYSKNNKEKESLAIA